MKIDKARELEPAELTKQVKESEDTMFRLRFQMTMGQNDGVKKYRELRKDRARMLTVVRERELQAATPAKTAATPAKTAAPAAAKTPVASSAKSAKGKKK